MTTTVEAVYEDGVLKLQHPLPLPEKTQVVVMIQAKRDAGEMDEREEWLRLSEATLTKAWDNSVDDVFNELLHR